MNKYLLALVCASFFACTVPVDVDSSGDPSIPRHPTDMGESVFAAEMDGQLFLIFESGKKVAACQLVPDICDDNNSCTDDACTSSGCSHNAANTGDQCFLADGNGRCANNGVCCVGTVGNDGECSSCDDGNPCTYDSSLFSSPPGSCIYHDRPTGITCGSSGTCDGKGYCEQPCETVNNCPLAPECRHVTCGDDGFCHESDVPNTPVTLCGQDNNGTCAYGICYL